MLDKTNSRAGHSMFNSSISSGMYFIIDPYSELFDEIAFKALVSHNGCISNELHCLILDYSGECSYHASKNSRSYFLF